MRIFITCILLAASNGCNGASTGDHDAGEPPHWSAGIYTTDYPNGMRTWLRVVAPDRVEQVALADTAAKGKVKLVKIDVDKNQGIAGQMLSLIHI